MIPIDVERTLPEGTEKVTYAKDQEPYLPLPAWRTPDGKVVSRWRLGPNELALLKNGVDVYLTVYTFNHPLQPIMLTVGPPDLSI